MLVFFDLAVAECPADVDSMGTEWPVGRIGFLSYASCPSGYFGNYWVLEIHFY